MALVTKNDVTQIFAIQAPEVDLPPTFANYPRGWDTARSNNGKPTIKQFNYIQQRTDQNILWMHQNGAALPYDAAMEYAEGAVVVKDGELQKKKGASWVSAANKGYNLDYFISGKSYPLHAEIMLENGDIVKNTIPNNITNPNIDMTGWVKTNDASQIFDQSGKSQQDINDLWNLFVGAKNDMSQDVSEIFTNYCNALNDGDAVVIPKGNYYWDSTKGTKVINKNINMECRGTFHVKPSGNQMLTWSGADDSITVPMTASTNLNKGIDRLNISSIAGLDKPQEYFCSMQSTEILTQRVGAGLELSTYSKNLTVDIVSNAFRLRDILPISWTDLSLGTLQFIKKKRPVTIKGFKIVPTESGVFNAISTNRASNITFEDLEINGNKSNSYTVRLDVSYNIRFKYSNTTDASAASGYYSIMNNQSSYIYMDGVGYVDDTATNRGYVGRHGYHCYFNECKLNGIDDHWGYKYFVNKSDLAIGVSVAGGDLTVTDTTSMQTLVRQRTDTPFNEGKLTIKNSWGFWGLLAITGHTTGGTFYTDYKAWDYIDIDVGLYNDVNYNNGIVTVAEPYQDIDTNLVFKETVMHIKNAVIQNNANGKQLVLTSKQRANSSGTGAEIDWFDGTFESKRLFSKIIIDTVDIINNTALGSINSILTLPCAKTIEIKNIDDFNFSVLRANTLVTDNVVIKESRVTSPKIDVGEWFANTTRTKENHIGYTWPKQFFPSPSSILTACRLFSRTYISRTFSDTVKVATAMSYETTNLNNSSAQDYKSRNNYVANTVYSYTFGADLVLAANSTSAEYFVSAPNNDVGNIVLGTFATGGDGLDINIYRTSHGHIKFRVRNLTAASVTVPSASVINFVLY